MVGKTIDRNGNPVAGVTVALEDEDAKPVTSVVSGSDGSFSFNNVPADTGSGVYRMTAKLDTNDAHLSEDTAFFMVYAQQTTTQDVTFYDYPPSSTGLLYGVVSSYPDRITPIKSVVYLDNGMYYLYEGNKDDQWSFNLPVGKYVIWAETNNDNHTIYRSDNYTVNVSGVDSSYQLIYLPTDHQIPYHTLPTPQENTVHGKVTQKNGMPLSGATIELCRQKDGVAVGSTKTSTTGDYSFNNVDVKSLSELYVIRVSNTINGETKSQTSDPIEIFCTNKTGGTHDYNLPITFNYVSYGGLNIDSTPSGAEVWIDGVDSGKATPYKSDQISVGDHSITLTMNGYYNDTFPATIQPDKMTVAGRPLSINTGTLVFNVKPDDASVYLNGKYMGNGSLNLTKLPSGQYKYLVLRDGYQNESGSIDVIPGKETVKTIDMVASPGLDTTYLSYLLGSMISYISGLF
ncbi:MAG TPA: carboxypeptidase regulatory-like domain-containing protein [Methanocella sp.]|nr:carboxypeptidase regulatory-like domain-containing protein [Methanocella sp.]